MRRLIYRLTVAVLVPVLGAVAAPSAATATAVATTATPDAAAAGPAGSVSAELLAALQRDLGLTPAQATRLLTQQAEANRLNEDLTATLGADFAGSWIDPATGRLNVAVANAGRAGLTRTAGADVTVVRHSMRALEGIMADLDALAEKSPAAMAAATAWSVDPRRNQVVVTVRTGQAGAFAPVVAGYGVAVGIDEADAPPTEAADRLDGGDPFDSSGGGCSVGFNTTMRDGAASFVTAGHCAVIGADASSAGVVIGPFRGKSWPGSDFAVVRNDNTAFWRQGPTVNPYDGNPNSIYVMDGQRDSAIGTAICKSGRTTRLTCGRVTGKNETVTTDSGSTVSQLTRHSACVEPGDSGGSNFSFTSTSNFAEGITSLARLRSDGTRKRCLSVFGEANVSWFQPIAEALTTNSLTLTVR